MFFIIVTNNEAFFCKSLCLLLSLFGSLAITRHAEARWPSGRAPDSGARGPYSGRLVVSLSKIHLPPKTVLVIPRKRWLHPDMAEKLLNMT